MARTTVVFRDGQVLILDGEVGEIARRLHGDGPVRLTTLEGQTVCLNWFNVLYMLEDGGGEPSVPGDH